MEVLTKGKKSYAEVAKIDSTNESSISETVMKEKEIRASFAVGTSNCRSEGTTHDKHLV